MAFTLFSGFGLGSLLFQVALTWGFVAAPLAFGSRPWWRLASPFRCFKRNAHGPARQREHQRREARGINW